MFLRRLAGVDVDAIQRLQYLSADIQLTAAEIATSACLEWQAAQSELKQFLTQRLVHLFHDQSTMVHSRPTLRASAGDTLARLGNPRPEVMTLTDMQFCFVAEGSFWMGSDEYNSEKPFHQNDLSNYDYWISRYPITNAKFQHFVDAKDGYINNNWWTKDGFKWRGNRKAPDKYGGVFDLSNHPVVSVRWYEAVAFTRWLTAQLRQEGHLLKDWEIRLP